MNNYIILGGTIGQRIMTAFQPIIELMQGLSYPVAFVMMAAGILLIISGNKRKGGDILKWASIGYVIMQFLPAIMSLLSSVAGDIK